MALAIKGDRVESLAWKVQGPDGWDDSLVVPPGTEGTVLDVMPVYSGGEVAFVQVWTLWDNGRTIALLEGEDAYQVVTSGDPWLEGAGTPQTV